MNIPLLLGIAYAVVAALLLNLNLASPWRREIKFAAIFWSPRFMWGLILAHRICAAGRLPNRPKIRSNCIGR